MTKFTAANSKLLAAVKTRFNAPIFKRASQLLNSAGPEATIEFLGGFYGTNARPERIAEFQELAGLPNVEGLLLAIAQKHTVFETLEMQGSDRLDFRSIAASDLRNALLAAYEAGKAAR